MTRDDERDDLATITFEYLSELDEVDKKNSTEVGENAKQWNEVIERVLEPALRVAPKVVNAMTQRGKYLVEFSAKGTAALHSGAVKFLQRSNGRLQPTLVAGRFQENAVLVGGVSSGVAAAMSISHLVIVLAVQAQLASMEKSLERIEKKIDVIRRWLDQEKLAQVRGRLRALHKLRDQLATSKWAEESRLRWQIALDAADVEFHQIEELARLQCNEAADELRAARMNVRFTGPTGESIASEAAELLERHQCNEELLLLALLGRLVAAHFRTGLGISVVVDDLQEDLARTRSASQEYFRLVEERMDEFSTWFRSAKLKQIHGKMAGIRHEMRGPT